MISRLESGQNLARKPDFRPGSTIAQHRVLISKPTLISSIWGVLEAPEGQIDLPVGGALRIPPAGRSIRPAEAAGTPNIDDIKVKFIINSKLKENRNVDLAF